VSVVGNLVIALQAQTSHLEAGFKRSRGLVSGWVSEVQSLLGGLAAGFTLGSIVQAFAEQELAATKLQAVLKATGNVAGVTVREIEALAADLQATTIFSDETVVNAAAMLATFKGIRGDTFEQTLRLAADLASVFDLDLATAARTLGKALDDPGEGLTALGKIGVRFTDVQRDMMKQLVETGQAAKAQALILRELETRVGGAAKAIGEKTTGKIEQLKNALSDLGELLAEKIGLDQGIKDFAKGVEHLRGGPPGGPVRPPPGAGLIPIEKEFAEFEKKMTAERARGAGLPNMFFGPMLAAGIQGAITQVTGFNGVMADLDKQLRNVGLAASEGKIFDWAEQFKLTAEQVQQLLGKLHDLEDAQAALRLFEETRTPLEQFNQEMDRLLGLLGRNAIDIDLFLRGADLAMKRFGPGESGIGQSVERRFAPALIAGSREAASAVNRHAAGANVIEVQRQQLDVQKQMQAELQKILDALLEQAFGLGVI